MLRYNNGRFFAPGVSFSIPDGFFLDTEPEAFYEYGFSAWTPDRQFYVEWQVETGCLGTEKELRDLFSFGAEIRSLSDIQSVTVNGMSGHCVAYENRFGQFWEMRLSVCGATEISLLVKANGGDILTAMDAPSIQAAIDAIRLP